ncbi:hypothetical protein HYPGJ_20210 [Hyphomicrobium sp. GJ21]|nr:hypothetical protein HYPGJ_20210 [Hyphomicrobium sp. GJ21]
MKNIFGDIESDSGSLHHLIFSISASNSGGVMDAVHSINREHQAPGRQAGLRFISAPHSAA